LGSVAASSQPEKASELRGSWERGTWYLEWHTEAEHPDWTATYELLRPYPNQRQWVVYWHSHRPPAS
jgi:hypothetical protein